VKAGLARATDNRDPWTWHPAKAALKVLAEETARTGGFFEAYDLTDRFGIELDHPARWGALFSAAATEGLIAHAGFAVSRRPTRAGGITRVWRGTDKARRRAAA